MAEISIEETVNNPEFTKCIADAAPYRVKIIQDLSPQMKEIKKEYEELMIDTDYKHVSDIFMKLKLDKKDEQANADLKKWRKDIMLEFNSTLKSIHPNEGQTPSVGMIYKAGKMLTYINRVDIIESVLEDKSTTMNFKKLEELNSKFNNDDIRARFIQLFKDADEVQGQICSNADMIKKDIYESLPSSIKYDKKANKRGIKAPNFQAIVRNKAMGMIKDSDKYTKYINSQISNSNDNIYREEVILGKTKQM